MGGNKRLSKRQLAVIEDMFAGELDEQAVLAKHNLTRRLYNRWLADERFRRELSDRIEGAYRQSEIILARYAPLAAAKLVELVGSDSHETVRKACLDIILHNSRTAEIKTQNTELRRPKGDWQETADELGGLELSDGTASKLLAVLADSMAAG